MKVTPFIIEKFAKFIVGGVPFVSMQRVVASLQDSNLTGAAKREIALTEFQTMGYGLAEWLLNLALELAVAWLKSKATR